MPKRASSTDGWLKLALGLARRGRREEALQLARKLNGRPMNSGHLRKMALVNSYCGMLPEAAECWLAVERNGDMRSGDFYMLGSLLIGLSRDDMARNYLKGELEAAKREGSDYYLESSAVLLAHLLIKVKAIDRAREVLALLGDGSGDHIPKVGFRTKSLSVNYVDLHRHFAENDDRRSDVIECDEAAL